MKESTNTSALPTTRLHCEGKLARASFPYRTSTNALPKTTLHSEGNLTHASFPSIVKANQHMLSHLIAHAQVHSQKQHFLVHKI